MTTIHVTDIEAAINYWRIRAPAVGGFALSPEVGALAEIYAHLAQGRLLEVEETALSAQAMVAWLAWYDSTPDTPCIAICSTSQGDARCKGCGRTFDEVQHWTAMNPVQKRATWHRIIQEGTAWRFNKYAERAVDAYPVEPRTSLYPIVELLDHGVQA
ncbi:MAG: DUF3717 domain-containing protein [Rhodoferax sp.]|nr:DUF3717 domain-containing protein [Rhodoferax sp.]MCF8211924.1 DUF3717 domain-containing protein [Rhodoferax sp.]